MADVIHPPKPISKIRLAVIMSILIIGTLTPMFLRYSGLRPHQTYASALIPLSVLTSAQEKVRPGIPQRLKIPKINLNVAVEHIGLTSQGDLDAPKNISSTGWYKDGVRPGEIGNAVIDGHYGWVNGEAAIFNDIHKLQKGDELIVEDEKGVSVTFIVTGSRSYTPGENATAVFHSDDGKARLNLITCQGEWEKSQNSYATRLVVFSDQK